MLRERVNEFEVVLDIIPRGPLLIVEGEQRPSPAVSLSEDVAFDEGVAEALELLKRRPQVEKEEVGGIDAFFVRTRRNGGAEPFIPGSSLKGTLRQRAEQLARTMGRGCCDPFARSGDIAGQTEVSCSVRIEQRRQALAADNRTLQGPEVYRLACPVCKIFGCLALASRLQITDGYLVEGFSEISTRDGVGIDRQRGGAREKAKFRHEVLEAGRFRTRLRVRNFELWQLGLLAYLLDDLIESRIRLGHGTHRGLGKIGAQVQEMTLTYFGARVLHAEPDRVEVLGMGSLAAETGLHDAEAYGFTSEDGILIKDVSGKRDGLRYRWYFQPAQQEQLWAGVAPLWQNPILADPEESLGEW